jgi:hypothetical protein
MEFWWILVVCCTCRSSLSSEVIKKKIDPVLGLIRWFCCQGRQARSNPKAKQQAWFQGVFFEASDANQDRGADECGNDLIYSAKVLTMM